MQAANRLFQRF